MVTIVLEYPVTSVVMQKTEAICFSKTLIIMYKTAWCHNPQDHSPDTQFGLGRSNGKIALGRRACGMGVLNWNLAK
jgi:hypothetical protein